MSFVYGTCGGFMLYILFSLLGFAIYKSIHFFTGGK